MHLGIVSAITREYELIEKRFCGEFRHEKHCGLEFLTGESGSVRVTLVRCGVGKVASALAAALLCGNFHVDRLLFVGCAGSVNSRLHCGDIVVASRAAQHDMDARPFVDECVIPDIDKKYLEASSEFAAQLTECAERFVTESFAALPGAKTFEIKEPRVLSGVVCTGDLFVSTAQQAAEIRRKIPDADVVEMEGAALAQVADQAGVQWGIVRVVSDEGSASQFDYFADLVVGQVSLGIVEAVIQRFSALKE